MKRDLAQDRVAGDGSRTGPQITAGRGFRRNKLAGNDTEDSQPNCKSEPGHFGENQVARASHIERDNQKYGASQSVRENKISERFAL
jgi:hypothetical protein